MIRNNKIKFAMSTVITLLPAILTLIFWTPVMKVLDESFVSVGNGGGKMAFIMFSVAFPVFLAILNTVMMLVTGLDKRALEQSEKVKTLMFFICPFISFLVAGINLSILLYSTFNPLWILCVFVSLLFVIIGNYMPKMKQNSYLGVKMRYTLANKENWEKTHRFAGKLWFIGGLVSIPCVFLPEMWGAIGILVLLCAMVIPVPIYSYLVYKNHIESGAYTKEDYKSSATKKPLIATVIIILVVCVVLFIVTFTGSVEATLTDTTLEIKATYWEDLSVNFADIGSIEYRENGVDGMRINGYGSPNMQLGWFTNEEFGNYTSYTLGEDACIVIKANKEYLVVGLETDEQTRALYDGIMQRVVID